MFEKIKNGLIVSCQAPQESPLRKYELMAMMAESAEAGGAAGIRAEGLADVKKIKETVSLPVILEGVAAGVRNGGNLMFRRPKIITKGLAASLPDAITLNIEHLKIGMFIYIKDIRKFKWIFYIFIDIIKIHDITNIFIWIIIGIM